MADKRMNFYMHRVNYNISKIVNQVKRTHILVQM